MFPHMDAAVVTVIMQKMLCQDIPCRNYQISCIMELIGQPGEPLPPAVFVYGHTATGKTLVVSHILEALQYSHAVVNCIECYMPQLLFEPILNKIHGHELSCAKKYVPYASCDYMMDFVSCLRDSKIVAQEKKPCIIVLDKCEKLRDMDANLLPAFLRLQELTKLNNICVFFLSDVVWEKFRIREGFQEPIQIHFPQYTKDELVEILLRDHPPGGRWPNDFYCSYVKLFLGIFQRACRDLNELRHMAQLNFPKYCDPVLKGETQMDDVNKLWRHVTPHLRSSLAQLYLRTVSSYGQEEPTKSTALSSSATYVLSFDLPYYAKFFLIASYLASYNPAKADRRLFVKNHGKERKKKQQQKKLAEQLLGPKPFALDRLLAIFYAIIGEDVNLTASLLSQMSSLVRLQLLTAVGDDNIDLPRYKCAVDFEFINTVARTVNFNIQKYLYEFM
ncbi:origin recognition complex subunit 5 isoform X2 [Zootermopsis nevadensis]|uniref:origin recognition complex subunit 5 isoform X2 n=1 Tax=Zootermopsis nevadensis TaxID=136037 RepID=UPI000B8E358D|nr:origin recognition complex subunit 5 isoform X2 [Zootermopsis nevadensis]